MPKLTNVRFGGPVRDAITLEADRKAIEEGDFKVTIELDFSDLKELLEPAPKTDENFAVVEQVGPCLSGFYVGQLVRVTFNDVGTRLPYQVTSYDGKGTGWARTQDIKFIDGGAF